jgi:hypothetical protein
MAAATSTRARPRDESADRIRAALAALEQERTAAEQRVNDETARRAALLVTGTPEQIRDAEEALRLVRIDIERIGARAPELESRLAVAVGREKIAEVEALRPAADRAMKVAIDWWEQQYPKLAAEIVAGLELLRTASQVGGEFNTAAARAAADPDVQAARGLPERDPLEQFPWAWVGNTMRRPELFICLPAVQPGPAIAWPYGFSLERPKRAGEAAAYS